MNLEVGVLADAVYLFRIEITLIYDMAMERNFLQVKMSPSSVDIVSSFLTSIVIHSKDFYVVTKRHNVGAAGLFCAHIRFP